MKKIFRYLGITLLASFTLSFMINFFTPKPFKFEDFKTREEAQAYFDEHYPVGSDVNILFGDLKKVRVDYIKERERIPPQEMGKGREDLKYDKVYVSKYTNNWLSKDPMGIYVIGMFILHNKTIAEVTVHKWAKFT
jgi:hypothetical protein